MITPVIITILVVVAVLVLIVVCIGIMMYNRLVRLKISAEKSWADVDVELKRRHDLVPNLVETVKGYASHEKETLDAVVKARAAAVDAGSVGEASLAEGLLSQALGRLLAVVEAYPDLKANANFMQLQGELVQTENRISTSRQAYNGTARQFNEYSSVFPSNVVAGFFRFDQLDYFELKDEAAREAPKVQFSS